MDLSSKFTDIAGVAHRISQLVERLNALGDFWDDLFPEEEDPRTASSIQLYDEWAKRRSNGNSNFTTFKSSDSGLLPAWSLRDVTFSAPMSTDPLVSNLNLTLSVGESVLIVGNSSAGNAI